MDFVDIKSIHKRGNNRKTDILIQPGFLHGDIKDLVVRGGAFYAFWNGKEWSTKINSLITAVDADIRKEYREAKSANSDKQVGVLYLRDDDSGVRKKFDNYTKLLPNSDEKFNTHILFSDHELVREDYATTKLSYKPEEMDTPAFDKMMSVLYDPEELEKILWFMGATLSNSMSDIQKFMYLYGGKGTGKGTVIDIFKEIFQGYFAEIDLAKLTGGSEFATAQVQEVPVLVDSDSDISKIKQDVNLLKLTAHEPLTVNKKYQSQYDVQFDGLLVTASNQRYKSGNVDSGINRRAVVVEPSGRKIALLEYRKLYKTISFELPGIAMKAIKVFEDKGAAYYENETDVKMMMATDIVFGFVRENAMSLGDPTSLKKAAELYKLYLQDLGLGTEGYKRKIKNELQRYYTEYDERNGEIDGIRTRSIYRGFKRDLVFPDQVKKEATQEGLSIDIPASESKFNAIGELYPAQYANDEGTPKKKWEDVKTTLKDIDTTKLHYVRVPINHIVIDFDLKNADGDKDKRLNLVKAAEFPDTYAEFSKGGSGVHLHYIYEGDVTQLASMLQPGIEVKVYSGKSSLRRRVSYCNGLDIATISTGLPLKEEVPNVYKDVEEMVWTEKKMRTAVKKNLNKEYHHATKPSMDFIAHIFEQAEKSGVEYDLTDMRNDILVFASKSTHNADYTIKLANKINYSTVKKEESRKLPSKIYQDEELYFFDIEVFPNLLIVAWKQYGIDKVTRWLNPSSAQIEWLTNKPLVGFNNRRYDNHILYSRLIGDNNLEMFHRSHGIITNKRGFVSGGYGLCYADIFDYSSKKQSLKKWEVELGIKHDELDFPWDQPLDEKDWNRTANYCANDVVATEEVFKATYNDYVARKIISELSGLPLNATTQDHAAAFLFGDDKRPQDKFVYTDLSNEFPGYKFERGVSTYMGDIASEGGFVYSEPGVYKDVAEIDIASMHPSSLIKLNYFGEYTERYAELKQARIYVKHQQFDKAEEMFGGVLKPYLENVHDSASLAFALKIIINIVYGMSSASYDNKFKHPKNIDNIVAKRGALFMITLKHAAQEAGIKVVHIKTDSIKIANATDKQIRFIVEFGKKYGYDFELEHIFDRLALVNKSVLIGHVEDSEKWGKESNTWEAIGAQYAEPYVYKTIFAKEEIEAEDFATTKQVKSSMYLGDTFIGKVGQVYASKSGQELKKESLANPDAPLQYVTKTKGFNWKQFKDFSGKEDVDIKYYDALITAGIESIVKVASSEEDVNEFFRDATDIVKSKVNEISSARFTRTIVEGNAK